MIVGISTPSNARLPMLITLLGMVIEVRPEQYMNAPYPMLVTLLGMVTEVRLEQYLYLQLVVYQFVLIKTVEK